MTAYRGLYVKGTSATPSIGTTPLEARLVSAGHIAENSPGVPRVGALFQSAVNLVTATATTAPLSYNIGACNLVLNRVAGEGVYEVSLVGTTVANTIAAPSSNSRWDLIYVNQNDVEKGDPDNTAVVGVVNGIAAASPTKPYASVPAGALVLAEAQIFAGTTATNGGTNTLAQVWRYTALRGAPIPVRNVTERGEITPSTGLRVQRIDLGPAALETWNGTVWQLSGARRHAEFVNASFNTQGGQLWDIGALSVDAANTFNNSFVTTNSLSGSIKFVEDGVYNIDCLAVPGTNPGAGMILVKYSPSNATIGVYSKGNDVNNPWELFAPVSSVYLPSGTIILFRVQTASSVNLSSRVRVTKVSD